MLSYRSYFEKHCFKILWSKELGSIAGELRVRRFEGCNGNVFWNANVAPGDETKIHKIYKPGRRNISQVWILILCQKQEGRTLAGTGVDGGMECRMLAELKVVGHFPLYLCWTYLK